MVCINTYILAFNRYLSSDGCTASPPCECPFPFIGDTCATSAPCDFLPNVCGEHGTCHLSTEDDGTGRGMYGFGGGGVVCVEVEWYGGGGGLFFIRGGGGRGYLPNVCGEHGTCPRLDEVLGLCDVCEDWKVYSIDLIREV